MGFTLPLAQWHVRPGASRVTALQLLEDANRTVALGDEQGLLELWRSRPVAVLCGHHAAIAALGRILLRGEDVLLSMCRAGTVCLWSPVDGACLRRLESVVQTRAPRGLAVFGSHGIAVCGDSHRIETLDLRRSRSYRPPSGHTQWIAAVATVPTRGGGLVLSIGRRHDVIVWRTVLPGTAGDNGGLRLEIHARAKLAWPRGAAALAVPPANVAVSPRGAAIAVVTASGAWGCARISALLSSKGPSDGQQIQHHNLSLAESDEALHVAPQARSQSLGPERHHTEGASPGPVAFLGEHHVVAWVAPPHGGSAADRRYRRAGGRAGERAAPGGRGGGAILRLVSRNDDANAAVTSLVEVGGERLELEVCPHGGGLACDSHRWTLYHVGGGTTGVGASARVALWHLPERHLISLKPMMTPQGFSPGLRSADSRVFAATEAREGDRTSRRVICRECERGCSLHEWRDLAGRNARNSLVAGTTALLPCISFEATEDGGVLVVRNPGSHTIATLRGAKGSVATRLCAVTLPNASFGASGAMTRSNDGLEHLVLCGFDDGEVGVWLLRWRHTEPSLGGGTLRRRIESEATQPDATAESGNPGQAKLTLELACRLHLGAPGVRGGDAVVAFSLRHSLAPTRSAAAEASRAFFGDGDAAAEADAADAQSARHRFAAVCADGSIAVYDVFPAATRWRCELVCVLRGHSRRVRSVEWDAARSLLAVEGTDSLSMTRRWLWEVAADAVTPPVSLEANTLGLAHEPAPPRRTHASRLLPRSTPLNGFAAARVWEIDIKSLGARLRASPYASAAASPGFGGSGVATTPECGPELSLLSYLLHWGTDTALDTALMSELGLEVPDSVDDGRSFGMRGAGNALTLSWPGGDGRWECGAGLSATLSLALLAAFLGATRDGERSLFSRLITHYGVVLPEMLRARGAYDEPSLRMLGAAALSSGEDVRVAARLLMHGSLQCMAEHARVALATQWAARLHFGDHAGSAAPPAPPAVKTLVRSSTSSTYAGHADPEALTPAEFDCHVLVLGSIGVSHPMDLAPKTARAVTLALLDFLKLGIRSEIRGAYAAELLGKGFALWRPHIPDLVELIRLLVRRVECHRRLVYAQRADSILTLHTACDFYACLAGLYNAPGDSQPSPNHRHRLSRTLRTERSRRQCVLALSLSLARNATPSAERPFAGASAFPAVLANDGIIFGAASVQHMIDTGWHSLNTASQRSLAEIGSAHPLMVVKTAGAEAVRPELRPADRCVALEVIMALVRHQPALLVRHLPAVAEAVIKTLDPSEPEVRKGCLKASTVALHDLVRRYPMIHFNQETQRFAVGTTEAVIILYDLRTATKWRILEGHTGPITALAFESSGEKIASYCALDTTARSWQAGVSGFFGGILGIRGRCLKQVALPSIDIETAQSQSSMNGSGGADDPGLPKEGQSQIRWVGPNKIRLQREDGTVRFVDM